MDAHPSLEARVATLERSLRRSRAVTAALGLAALVVVAAAFAQQPSPSLEARLEARLEERLATRLQADLDQRLQEQAREQVATQRLALTSAENVELVVLRGDADGSLLLLTPGGAELMRLGGPMARRIEH